MSVKPIPEGFHTVTPYLLVQGASKLIDFLKNAFHAKEAFRTDMPDGTVMHAQLKIGDSFVMIADAKGSQYKPMPTMLYLYVQDTDSFYKSALKAGATSIMEPVDQFYGDRNAAVQDAFGNQWWIATHFEDVSESEIRRRAKERFGK